MDSVPGTTGGGGIVRFEIVHKEVRPGQEPVEYVAPAGVGRVQRNALIVAVEVQEGAAFLGMRLPAGEGRQAADGVAAGRLHFDYARPEVGHELSRVRRGKATAEFDDLQSFQSACHRVALVWGQRVKLVKRVRYAAMVLKAIRLHILGPS